MAWHMARQCFSVSLPLAPIVFECANTFWWLNPVEFVGKEDWIFFWISFLSVFRTDSLKQIYAESNMKIHREWRQCKSKNKKHLKWTPKKSVELLKTLTRTNRMTNRNAKKDRQYVVMASIKAWRRSKRIHTRTRERRRKTAIMLVRQQRCASARKKSKCKSVWCKHWIHYKEKIQLNIKRCRNILRANFTLPFATMRILFVLILWLGRAYKLVAQLSWLNALHYLPLQIAS